MNEVISSSVNANPRIRDANIKRIDVSHFTDTSLPKDLESIEQVDGRDLFTNGVYSFQVGYDEEALLELVGARSNKGQAEFYWADSESLDKGENKYKKLSLEIGNFEDFLNSNSEVMRAFEEVFDERKITYVRTSEHTYENSTLAKLIPSSTAMKVSLVLVLALGGTWQGSKFLKNRPEVPAVAQKVDPTPATISVKAPETLVQEVDTPTPVEISEIQIIHDKVIGFQQTLASSDATVADYQRVWSEALELGKNNKGNVPELEELTEQLGNIINAPVQEYGRTNQDMTRLKFRSQKSSVDTFMVFFVEKEGSKTSGRWYCLNGQTHSADRSCPTVKELKNEDWGKAHGFNPTKMTSISRSELKKRTE